MKIKEVQTGRQDGEIARRFALLRQEDAALLCDFPDEQTLARRQPLLISRDHRGWVAGIAAGLVLAFIPGVLLTTSEREDPGAVYAGIMATSHLQTDVLLSVSDGEMNEVFSLSGALDIGRLVGTGAMSN